MSATVLHFPKARLDTPSKPEPGVWGGPNVHFLRCRRRSVSPRCSAEMELIVALLAALRERSGLKTIKDSVLHKLQDAAASRVDPDTPRIHWPEDPTFRVAVNALCGVFE